MRILLLSAEFPPGPGGIGTHAFQLANQIQQLGQHVLVVAPQNYASELEVANFNRRQSFRIVRLRQTKYSVRKAMECRNVVTKQIQTWKPDLIVSSGPRVTWLVALITKMHRVPLVAVGHGSEFGVKRLWERAITRWAFEQALAVVCVSNYTWQQMRSLGVEPRGGTVITNGADSGNFTVLPPADVKQFREQLSLANTSLILSVGNVSERKGQSVLIQAMPHILRQIPNTHYLIIGLPTKRQEFAALAARLGVAQHVHFIGRVGQTELVRYMNICDVFAMTSRHTSDGDFEGFGIALVEAALCGKPSVVSGNSGLTEAIDDGVSGFSVPEDDEVATSDAVVALLKDSELRRKMGAAARDRALECQTWTHCAKQYDILFREILAN